jgi:predicted nucleic acid-binding protein
LKEYEKIYTPVNVLAEVYEFFKRENKNFGYVQKVIESNSEIYHFSEDEWLDAINKKIKMRKSGAKNFGLMDAMVMVCAENTNSKIITGDPHFEKIDGVIFIKKPD